MDTLKMKPGRLLIGKTNEGLPFVVAPSHIVSMTENPQAISENSVPYIVWIKIDSGDTIVAESEGGILEILNALGGDYPSRPRPDRGD